MSEPTDPKRLADADPSSRLGRLMTSATQDVPSEAQLTALAAQLETVLAPAPGAAPSPGFSTMAKLAAATGAAVLIGGAVVAVRARPFPQPTQGVPVSVSAPAAAASPTTSFDTPATPSSAPATITTTAASSPAGSSPPAGKKPGVEPTKSAAATSVGPSESRLLEQARRALPNDPGAALALTDQDAALFPRGVLVQEREVIAIEALRRLNRTAEADRRAAAFSKAFPGSAHQRVIKDAAAK
jgi:hypothetical protein